MKRRFLCAKVGAFVCVGISVSAGDDVHRADVQSLLKRNQRFAAGYEGGLRIAPKFSTVILTCIDARVDPAHFLGLEPGDALVYRNAGARVTDDVELDLGILSIMLARAGGEQYRGLSLMIVQHTDCGLERLADPGLAADLSKGLGVQRAQIDGLANVDHTRHLLKDAERLRRSSMVPKDMTVSGYVFRLEDGTLEQVIAPAKLSGGQEKEP